jgi:hypothetical protein
MNDKTLSAIFQVYSVAAAVAAAVVSASFDMHSSLLQNLCSDHLRQNSGMRRTMTV